MNLSSKPEVVGQKGHPHIELDSIIHRIKTYNPYFVFTVKASMTGGGVNHNSKETRKVLAQRQS
jgi:hypothetical protein